MSLSDNMKETDFTHEELMDKSDEEIHHFYRNVGMRYNGWQMKQIRENRKKDFYTSMGKSFAWMIACWLIGAAIVYAVVIKFLFRLSFG